MYKYCISILLKRSSIFDIKIFKKTEKMEGCPPLSKFFAFIPKNEVPCIWSSEGSPAINSGSIFKSNPVLECDIAGDSKLN